MTDRLTNLYIPRRGKWFVLMQRRFRQRRFALIQQMIEAKLKEAGMVSILDVGGRANYWTMLPDDLRPHVSITLLNSEAELANYFDSSVSGLCLKQVIGDGCDLSQYRDRSFDIVHSNSVLEHVGNYANMLAFAHEIRRVAVSYYVQTPNFWFPIDPHTAFPIVHWLPDPARLFLLTHASLGYAKKMDFKQALLSIDGTRMVSRRFMQRLFPDARHLCERVGFLFIKSLIAVRDK